VYEFKNTNRGSGCHNIFLAAFVLPVKKTHNARRRCGLRRVPRWQDRGGM